MTTAKRKVSVSLDEELVKELEGQRRRRLLMKLLDRLDAEHGPVDESLIEKYAGFLG
jgi:hypothetical protein